MRTFRLLSLITLCALAVACDEEHRETLGSASGIFITGATDETIAKISLTTKAITLPRVVGESMATLIVSNRETIEFEVDVETSEWLSVDIDGVNVFINSKSDNMTLVRRVGNVTFIAGEGDDRASTELTVEQESYPEPTLTLNKTEILLNAAEGSYDDVKVKTNQESLDITYSEGTAEWCSAVFMTDTLRITAKAKNLQEVLNEGKIYISSAFIKDSIIVKQKTAAIPYKIGDPFPKNAPYEGIMVSVAADGTSGVIMSLDAKEMLWSYSMTKCGTTNSTDGVGNTKQIVEIATKENNLNENGFAAVYACVSRGEGWYLPAWREFGNIVLTGCGLLTDEGVAAFSEKITAAGGTPLDKSAKAPRYWSSSEYGSNSEQVYRVYVNTSGAPSAYQSKKTNLGVVRCLKSVQF